MVNITNLGAILIAVVAIVSIILIILIFLEKKLYKKASKVKYTKNLFYIEKISQLNLSNSEATLKNINKIARNFFREAFKTQGSTEYSELEEIFTKKNNKKITEFCKIMSNLFYSGKKPDKKTNQNLINLLVEIIEKNKIISKYEKKRLDKKSLEKDKKKIPFPQNLIQKIPFLRKIETNKTTPIPKNKEKIKPSAK
ncbi:MAG: hypothetical protein KKF48_03825 [Nanoarchaeota archaeon]|nr:hypothetical protein [Nanoarchaeota archaeon]MBU1028147.1 hypothetical protein [Nanoarchaeota archaeon]